MNDSIRAVLVEHLDAYPDIAVDPHYFIFFNTLTGNYFQPIKRRQPWKLITTICQSVGIRGIFGTHYHAWMNGVDLALIVYKLNHSGLAYTKR